MNYYELIYQVHNILHNTSGLGKFSTPFTGSPWITTPLLYVVTEAKKTWCVFPSCCAHQVRNQRSPQPVIRYLRILGREEVASRSPGENTHKNLRQFFGRAMLGGIPSSKHPSDTYKSRSRGVEVSKRSVFFYIVWCKQW